MGDDVLVTVQGHGVVGQATAELLAELGHDVSVHDPAKGLESEPAEVVVVCTPCRDGFLDDDYSKGRTVVVRSTVRPEAFDALPDAHYWPEFLTERTAFRDVRHPDKIIWGTSEPESAQTLLMGLLGRHYLTRVSRTLVCSLRVAALIKLAVNSVYLTNVVLNNALYDASPEDYPDVITGIRLDRRLNPTHTDIYQDGYRGANGGCLPKDIGLLVASLTDAGQGWAAGALAGLAQANLNLLASKQSVQEERVG